MITSGGARRNWRFFAAHLMRTDENERVSIPEIRGLAAEDVREAFREMDFIASGTRCTNFFYHANMNPMAHEHLSPEQWEQAEDILERHLKLDGHARFVVEHEKEGRTHRHVVWLRIDPDTMTAVSDSFSARDHEKASREIEQTFGLEPVESVLTKDRDTERPERGPQNWETFRGFESGLDPREMKRQVTALYHEADSGVAFKAALEEAGYILARGDRRDFCIVDQAGDEHSLARRISGVKAAEIRARMSDIDREVLPSVTEARELARAQADTGGDAPQERPEAEKPQAEPEHAPNAQPDGWVKAPQGGPTDWTEAASGAAQSGEPGTQEAPDGWRSAEPGQASDQRPLHTAWERFAGRVRGYWERLTHFARDESSGSPDLQQQPEATDGEGKKSWVARVMESRPVQAGRDLVRGWGHRDIGQLAEGVRETASVIEDILASGPKQPATPISVPGRDAAPEASPPMTAFERLSASVDASALSPRDRTPSAFDRIMAERAVSRPNTTIPEPEPDSPAPEL